MTTRSRRGTALRIFGTNAKCQAYNKRKTEELSLQVAVYSVVAEHTMMNGQQSGNLGITSREVQASWLPASDDDCGGLSHKLRLGIGSRVMLRRNIAGIMA